MTITSQTTEALFAILGERLRLRMICCLLMAPDSLTVAELTDALNIAQPKVSRNLSLLKAAGLVEERRDGRWAYYRVRQTDHPVFESIRCCVNRRCCCEENEDDLRRLRERLRLRHRGKCVIGFRAKKPRLTR